MIHSIDVSEVLRLAVRASYADLVTRATGRAVREHIEQAYATHADAVALMDFTGVRCIDYSCADEIVAKLLRGREGGEAIHLLVLRGCSDAHLEALEPVLEGHGLTALLERPDGTLDCLGRPESAAALLEELVARRLAARTAGGAVALVAA